MYGRVSNHEIIIPYLSSFVGSCGAGCGVARVWLWCGRGVIVGVCEEGLGVRCGVGQMCECGENKAWSSGV